MKVLEGVESRSYEEGVDWTKGQVLGTGAFSICYQARDVQTGTLMAAKQISFSRTSEDEQRKVWRYILIQKYNIYV
jgi:mitogen-activated protein kinase kinase kinase 1